MKLVFVGWKRVQNGLHVHHVFPVERREDGADYAAVKPSPIPFKNGLVATGMVKKIALSGNFWFDLHLDREEVWSALDQLCQDDPEDVIANLGKYQAKAMIGLIQMKGNKQ